MSQHPPHTIQLRGPWILRPHLATNSLGPEVRGKINADWTEFLGAHTGPIRYLRHFNRPTGLESTDQVWLIVEGAHANLTIMLNDAPLKEAPSTAHHFRGNITDAVLRQPGHQLAIDVAHDGTGDQPILKTVALEICAS